MMKPCLITLIVVFALFSPTDAGLFADVANTQWRDLNQKVLVFFDKGEIDQALIAANQALALAEKNVGPDHSDVALSLNNLGLLHDSKGDVAQAQVHFERAIAIWGKAFEVDHSDTENADAYALRVYKRAIENYRTQGANSQSEMLYVRFIRLQGNTLGSEHSDVLDSLCELGALLESKGAYIQAVGIYRHVLVTYYAKDDIDKAVLIGEQLIVMQEEAHGADHHNVAESLNFLGMIRHTQKDFDKAVSLYQRALAIYEKTSDPNDSDWIACLNNLVTSYETKEDYAQAVAACERMIALYKENGHDIQATPHYARVIELQEKIHGADHIKVVPSLLNLAALYREYGPTSMAKDLYQRVLGIQEKILGPDHPDAAATRKKLADLQQTAEQESENLEQRIKQIKAVE